MDRSDRLDALRVFLDRFYGEPIRIIYRVPGEINCIMAACAELMSQSKLTKLDRGVQAIGCFNQDCLVRGVQVHGLR